MENVLQFKNKNVISKENINLMSEFNEFELTEDERARFETRLREANKERPALSVINGGKTERNFSLIKGGME